MNKTCHACGQQWESTPGSQPGRSETCVKCGADLHCCLNCSLFDYSSYICTSRSAEPVKDKEKRNFCDEFMMGSKGTPGKGLLKNDDMNQKWNDIFG
ncbi:MAG TPA: hypothetical protein VK791_01765 [bacterium]|jgi:hypothetical protein|nr:hypothetical protein [bacterium]